MFHVYAIFNWNPSLRKEIYDMSYISLNQSRILEKKQRTTESNRIQTMKKAIKFLQLQSLSFSCLSNILGPNLLSLNSTSLCFLGLSKRCFPVQSLHKCLSQKTQWKEGPEVSQRWHRTTSWRLHSESMLVVIDTFTAFQRRTSCMHLFPFRCW